MDLKCEKTFASFILWKKKPKTYIPLVFYSNVEFLAKFFNELSFNPIGSNYRWMSCIHNIAYRWMLCICSTSDNSRLKQKCISTTTYNVLYARHHPWDQCRRDQRSRSLSIQLESRWSISTVISQMSTTIFTVDFMRFNFFQRIVFWLNSTCILIKGAQRMHINFLMYKYGRIFSQQNFTNVSSVICTFR